VLAPLLGAYKATSMWVCNKGEKTTPFPFTLRRKKKKASMRIRKLSLEITKLAKIFFS